MYRSLLLTLALLLIAAPAWAQRKPTRTATRAAAITTTSPLEYLQAQRKAGTPVETVVADLRMKYRQSPEQATVLLRDAGYAAAEDAQGLMRGERLYNDGIINRSKSKEDFLEAGDGTVFIEGTNLNDPTLEVLISSRGTSFPAEVLERTTSGGEDVIKARFTNLHGGDLIVRTLAGGRASMPAKALAFWVTDDNLLDGEIAGLEIRLADEQLGTGTVVFNGSFGSSSEPIEVPPFQQPGLTVTLVDVRSQPPTLTMTSIGDGQLLMKVEIPFETAGRELQGTILEEITAWTCSSFQIDETECSPFGLGCITNVLGSAERY